jgi:hypothetical protein
MYDRIIQLSISADKAALTGMIARRRNINDVNIKYVLMYDRIIQLSISADKAALTGMIARRRNINDVNIKYVLFDRLFNS